MLKQIVVNQLMQAIVYWFKEAALSASPSKSRWIRQIIQVYREEGAIIHSCNPQGFNERILLSLLKVTAHFVN